MTKETPVAASHLFCPSCESQMPESSKFCSHCGMFLDKRSERLVHFFQDFGWIWRRSWAGFAAGFVAWIITFIVARMVQYEVGSLVNNLFSGMICGGFLGTVGGIIEESGYKSIVGGLLGTLGGAAGALLSLPVMHLAQNYENLTPLPILTTWAVGGAFIGMSSGVLERDGRKIAAGALFGFIGGGIGGYLGSAFYGSMLMEFQPKTWIASRMAEGLSGGLVGAIVWFFVGIIEKAYIFKRYEDPKMDKKICGHCGTSNLLRAWYCTNCGRVLQTSAPRQKIRVTQFRGMERIINGLRFLSWLFGATGFISTPVIFAVFLTQDVFLALISAVFSVLFTYLMVVGFRFIADLLSCLIRISSIKIEEKA